MIYLKRIGIILGIPFIALAIILKTFQLVISGIAMFILTGKGF